jgi:hypothetical protein
LTVTPTALLVTAMARAQLKLTQFTSVVNAATDTANANEAPPIRGDQGINAKPMHAIVTRTNALAR